MAKVSIYLTFSGKTEEAFNFYKEVFGTEFVTPINYMRDVPPAPGDPELSEAEKGMVMHVALPMLGGTELMGTDALESRGHSVTFGSNISINLEPDTRAETERLFSALSAGGQIGMPLQEMFWGDYFGACTDKFGVRWMVNCTSKT